MWANAYPAPSLDSEYDNLTGCSLSRPRIRVDPATVR